MSAAPNTVRSVLAGAEVDMRSVPDLLTAIQALAEFAHLTGRGLDIDECRGLERVAAIAFQLAKANVAAWDRLHALTAGEPA